MSFHAFVIMKLNNDKKVKEVIFRMAPKILKNGSISVEIDWDDQIAVINIDLSKKNYSGEYNAWLLGDDGVVDLNALKGIDKIEKIDDNAYICIHNTIGINRTAYVIKKLILPKNVTKVPPSILIGKESTGARAWMQVEAVVWPDKCDTIPAQFFQSTSVQEVLNIDHVEFIGDGAFMNTSIEHISWPSKCNYIPTGAFASSNISRIDNMDHVTKICEGAFERCQKLLSFNVPANVTEIPRSCFKNSALEEISGTEHLEIIRDNAFSHCRLREFVWPSKCKIISERCFADTTTLSKVTNLECVREIRDRAFSTTDIQELSLSNNLRKIGKFAFAYSPILKIDCIDNVSVIGESAFEGCLIKSIKWPKNCEAVADGTFAECIYLSEVTGMQNVVSIGKRAFARTAIKSINLSDSLCFFIFENAFGGSKLEEIWLGYYTKAEDSAFPKGTEVKKA